MRFAKLSENMSCRLCGHLIETGIKHKKTVEADDIQSKPELNPIDHSSNLSQTICSKCNQNLEIIPLETKAERTQKYLNADSKLESKTSPKLDDFENNETNTVVCSETLKAPNENISDSKKDCDSVDEKKPEKKSIVNSTSETTTLTKIESKKPRKRKKIDIDEQITNLTDFEDVQINGEDQSLRLCVDNNVWESYPWRCTKCTEVFESIEKLQNHFKGDHKVLAIENPMKFSCYDCPKMYSKFCSFKCHILLHRTYLKFGCEICGKFFVSYRSLIDHRDELHKEIVKFRCDECGKWFNTKSYLQTHQNVHLPADQKSKFECDQCSKVFSTKNGLVAHIATHSGVREFVCGQCGKDFLRKSGLDEHLQTHSDLRPFKCVVCDRTFKSNMILKLHFQIHTGYKKHECDICGRKYRKKCSLHQHYRIHTGDMPFTCEFCGKSFRYKGVYQTHRFTHTGERPYSCQECDHYFTNWPNYNKHMKRKHGIDKSNRIKDSVATVPNGDNKPATATTTTSPTSITGRDISSDSGDKETEDLILTTSSNGAMIITPMRSHCIETSEGTVQEKEEAALTVEDDFLVYPVIVDNASNSINDDDNDNDSNVGYRRPTSLHVTDTSNNYFQLWD